MPPEGGRRQVLPERIEQLQRWLRDEVGLPSFDMEPASNDASFRRYFRVFYAGHTRIAMDAPPAQEDCRPFIAVAQSFRALGVNVPQVYHADLKQGFLLLSDFGTRLYLHELNADSVERLYGDALGALITLQACGPGTYPLPPYGRERLLTEMELFREWYLGRHRRFTLNPRQHETLDQAFTFLAAAALEQPQVAVHRDYHSRNLLVTAQHNPGILDFQDAVMGPITYDLVSLLRDCYIAWPRAQVEAWVRGYHDLALHSGILREENEQQFLRWFDLMGVQRHFKASGIFARLNHRDGKPGYLQDIPRTLAYVADVASRYDELGPLYALLSELHVIA